MDYRLVSPKFSDSPVTLDSITGQMFLKSSWKIPKFKKLSNITKNESKTDVYRLLIQVCEEPILSYRMAATTTLCSSKVPVTINMFYDAQRHNPVITCSINSISEVCEKLIYLALFVLSS